MMVLCFHQTVSFVIPAIIAVAGVALISKPLYCRFNECCNDRWIPENLAGLKTELNSKVFGQHIAIEVVYKAIKGHIENKDPSKALVLSLHGWTGCGKNHISNIIADNLYKKGTYSMYTHLISATHDFPHLHRVSEYREHLQKFIMEKVKQCPKSLFIFDEVDKVPPGLIDILKPFLDHHRTVDGVDYRKNIFIFLSNTGAETINNIVFDHWKQGNKRESLTIKDMDAIVSHRAFNDQDGGLWHGELIRHNLIDFFIPFLPLEKSHVKKCIKFELIKKGKTVTEDIINRVANSLQYDQENIFSKSGCKKISSRVDQVVIK